MATADKLVYLDETKDLLREAINVSGGALTELDPFREYVDPILWGWLVLAYGGLDLDYINERYRIFDPAYNALVEKPWADIVNNYSAPAGRTYFDSLGVLQTAAAGTPIRAFDPAAGAFLGNQIWGSYTNHIARNRAFLGGRWSSFSGLDISSVVGGGLDGGDCARATLLSTAGTQIQYALATPLPLGFVTIAILFKPETWSGNFQLAYYNGATTIESAVTTTNTVWERADGWKKLSFTFTVTSTSYASPQLRFLGYSNGGAIGDSCLLDFASLSYTPTVQPEIGNSTESPINIAAENQIIDGSVFSDIWNPAGGTLFVECSGAINAVALKAAGVEVVVDSASNKKYAVAYTSDPSATSLIIGANLNGYIRRIVYFRKELPASLIARLIA